MTTFIPSPQQSAIDHAVFNTTHNLAVSALSGTGKTSTLVWIAKRLPQAESKIFCAFNADIVKELQSKLDGTGVTARTFHSLGLGALKKYLDVKELPPKDDKYRVLVNKWAETDGVFSLSLSESLQDYEPEERGEKAQSLRKDTLSLFVKLLDLIRVKLVAWDDVAGMASLITMNQLDVDVPHAELVELVIRNVEYIMKQAEIETRKLVIDFTDMIYWAVKWNLRIYPYKWVLVDEAQDFNPLQREMIAKIIDPKGGRIILVGDPNQAIYAFSGADSDSFDLSVKRWNCVVLPLTMTRRCSQIITQHASRLVPDFNCPPDKPRGKIVWLDETSFAYEVKVGDMVVSRVTAPLVKEFLGLIARGIPSVILGKDMSKQFIALLDKLTNRKDYTFSNLLTCLATYESEQVDSATKKGDESLIEAIRDQCAGLRSFIEAYPDMPSIDGLTKKIEDLLGTAKPKEGVVVFCTVHKSKGLEADRVFILAPDKLPLKMKDMSPEQLQQEYNLLYVAETRAKSTLVIVTNPKFLKDNAQPPYAQDDFADKVWDKPTTPEPVVIEPPAESTETYPSFQTVIGDVLGVIGTSRGLYAPKGHVKMWVCRDETNTQLAVNTCQPDGTQSTELVDTLAEALDLMKTFEPNPIVWQLLSMDEWQTIYTPPTPETTYDKIVIEEKANWDADTDPEPVVDAITTPDDPYGQFQITVTALLALLPNSKGLFAVDGDTKLYVAPHISKMGMFFVETVNGEYTQEAVTLTEALDKMYAFSPIPFTWNTISANDWMFATAQHKTMKERKAEAQSTPLVVVTAPRPFASLVKQHLTELLTTYDPDRGLCADGETTTMYITTDLEDVFVMYERDYTDEDDMLWSRDSKEKNTELVLKRMEAINPSPDAWRMGKWSDWTDAVHDEGESDDITFDEQPSATVVIPPNSTPLATESPVIIDVSANESELVIIPDTPLVEAVTKQPVMVEPLIEQPVADKPQTPSADALLMDMLVKAMHTSDGNFGKPKLTEIARQLHLAIRSALPEMDWTDTIRARVKVAAKRTMRQHHYPPKNTYPPESIDSVADAICHIYEHGALPIPPVIPVDENSPYQVWKRKQEARDAAKLIAKTKETGEVVDVQLGLSVGDALKSTDATQPLVDAPPVVDPIPDEKPTDTTPTFSNGENPPTYQNGKDKSHTPAPLPSTAPNLLKVLIEEFRAFELPELDVALQAIDYVKREKTEGVGV